MTMLALRNSQIIECYFQLHPLTYNKCDDKLEKPPFVTNNVKGICISDTQLSQLIANFRCILNFLESSLKYFRKGPQQISSFVFYSSFKHLSLHELTGQEQDRGGQGAAAALFVSGETDLGFPACRGGVIQTAK